MVKTRRRYFESRHVNEFLGIDKNRLHRWTQIKNLIIPVIRSDGRGGRNKFSFENLLELDIVKELEQCGIELNTIGQIMRAIRNFKQASDETGEPIWTYIRNHRKHYEKAGGFLALLPGESKRIHAQLITKKEMAGYVSGHRGVILIGILAIIEGMEEKTDIKLLPPKE